MKMENSTITMNVQSTEKKKLYKLWHCTIPHPHNSTTNSCDEQPAPVAPSKKSKC